MILNGNNLGERHRDLNSKVSEAVAKQINFEELKSQPEECDVDKLFKIDIAAKYKNIDYILEVLKSGDVFYISRALKCSWMYTDEYSQFINPDYLEANIFPNMSIKMKRKMITAISTHVRNTDRVTIFYKYCKDIGLTAYAAKFLLFTPDSFKLNLLKSRNFMAMLNPKLLRQFIGRSFELARAYLEVHDYSIFAIRELHFLYCVSETEYLKILEYIRKDARTPYNSQRLGLRISKSILKKHKVRVFKNPVLYGNILHKDTLIKNVTTEDVETLAPRLLPKYPGDYWSLNFYYTYKFILDKIPANNIYGYMKQIYVSKYRKVEFKMHIEFYRLRYYEMLSVDEREVWALQHIKRDKELPGIKNYIWYKFVSFHKAFSGIKRYIYLTVDNNEKSQIVNILPETARNHKDIKKILNYYYGRHVNEGENNKKSFINKIIEFNDIYSFNDECWTIFDKLLYSLNVYDKYTTPSKLRPKYKFRSLVYHILHKKDIPEAITEYFENILSYSYFDHCIDELNEERKSIVAKYLLDDYAEKIETLMCHPDYSKESENFRDWKDGSIKNKIADLVCYVSSVIFAFKRSDEEYPAIVVKFMESHMDIYDDHDKYKAKFVKKSEGDFVRWLKQDIEMAVNGISDIRCNTYRWNFRLCRLFRKLKVYFPNDVAKNYLDYFLQYLANVPEGRREYRNIKMAVVGVFYLANPEYITCMLDENAPTCPKIGHMDIDNRVLQLQKAICRLSYHPRPPISLASILKYITGDYVHYCFPTIYNYFTSLPSSSKFVDSLLDAPLSIQKHGLRLAFRSYDADTLNPIIKSAWTKTRNMSLRMILYETLFDRILNENNEVQKKLYEVLKLYTSDLSHYDHDNVYSLLVSDDLPDTFKGDLIETAWITVSKLSDKSVDIQRRISIIRHMEKYIHLVCRDFIRLQIIDGHVKDMCDKNVNGDRDKDCHLQELIEAKWELTAKYIVTFNHVLEQQNSIQLIEIIMTNCVQSWNLINGKTYVVRKFINEFIETIINKDPKTIESSADIAPIYQYLLDRLQSFLKKEEMYLLNWKLKLLLTCKDIINNRVKRESDSETDDTRNMTSTKIAYAYGNAVAKMVMRSVKNNEFNHCFYKTVAETVNNIGCIICHILDIHSNGYVYNVCEGLIKTRMTETHLLALFMLPRDPDKYWKKEHRAIIKDIKKQYVSQEVQTFLYQKYVLSDYQVRQSMK